MPNHAGFASVVIVQHKVLETVLRVYHTSGVFPSSLTRSFQYGAATVDLQLFVDLPRLIVEPRTDGRIGVALRLVGTARLKVGAKVEQTTVVISTSIYAHVAVRASSRGGIQAGIDFSQASVTALDVGIDAGAPPLSQQLAAALRGPEARLVLGLFLQTISPQQASVTPPLLTQVTAIFGETPIDVALTAIRPLNSAIALAVDLAGVTKGDPNALTDFTAGASIAVACHPQVVLNLFERAKPQIMARKGDISIPVVNMTFGPDYLHIDGTARLHTPWYLPDADATFWANARIKLSASQILVDVFDVDLDIPDWLEVLGFLVGALGLGLICPPAAIAWPVVYPIAAALLDNFAEELAESTIERAARASRLYTFNLPETSGPPCRMRLDAVMVGSAGIEAKANFECDLGLTETRIDAPYKIEVGDPAPISAKLIVGQGLVHPADPSVRIRWEAAARPSGTVLQTQDRKLSEAGATTFNISHTGQAAAVRTFDIRCRVYRPTGSAQEDVYQAETRVYVHDRLDAAKGPFVRWSHWVYIAETTAAGKPTKAYLGHRSKERSSKIHRTQTPGRCKMADHYTERVDPGSKKYQRTPLEYLQALPFPVAQIREHRKELCDYCFFGGPNKTDPLPL